MTREVTDRLVDKVADEIKDAASHSSSGFWLKPDPDYEYRPAYVRVTVHNPAATPYSGNLSVRVGNERRDRWEGIFQGNSVPVPNLRPGESREVPVVLEEDVQSWYGIETQLESENRRRAWDRWWDNYNRPGLRMTLVASFHGRVPLDDEEELPFAVFHSSDTVRHDPKTPFRSP
jgi:hypothetical protein